MLSTWDQGVDETTMRTEPYLVDEYMKLDKYLVDECMKLDKP
jgi:hypothetical protein